MEWRLNLVMGALLLAIWAAGVARHPQPVAALAPKRAVALSSLEDDLARHPADQALLGRLSQAYLELDRPGLAVAVLRAAPPRVLTDPRLTHRLAEAYELGGRLPDALATASLAVARCDSGLGATPSIVDPSASAHRCDLRLRAALSMHRDALERMSAWGVTDPRHDPRAHLAYDLALRRVRIASVSK